MKLTKESKERRVYLKIKINETLVYSIQFTVRHLAELKESNKICELIGSSFYPIHLKIEKAFNINSKEKRRNLILYFLAKFSHFSKK